mgnify:FL=1
MKLTYFGQAGVLIETEESRFLIDPYLSNSVVTSGVGDARVFSRSFNPPLLPEELRGITSIFVTHDHLDHCDPETILPILKNNADCTVIGPHPAMDHLAAVGAAREQLETIRENTPKTIDKMTVTALPSAHYGLDQNPISGEYPYFGFVFELEGKVLYHAGDTILYDGLLENLRRISPKYDVCFLPVNGRDKEREALGMIGNLHPEEALQLSDLINAGLLIPLHNDLFASNHLPPQRLDDSARIHFPDLAIRWMMPGETLQI